MPVARLWSFLLCAAVLGSCGAGIVAEQHRATAGTRAAAPVAATPAKPAAGARLEMLSRLQAAAVGSGDPVRIADTSRALNAELLHLLAEIAAGENHTEQAVRFEQTAAALVPGADAQIQLATLLARAGQTDAAVAAAQAATANAPTNPRTWTTLASVLRAGHRDREAVAPLTRALQLDPNAAVAFSLGSALLAAHDKPRAEQVFQQLLAGSDDAAIWHVAIGDAYRENNYLEEAAAEFRKALARDPKATHAEFFLGLVNLQRNEWGPNSESFLHLRKSAEQNPHEYLSNFYLGALESTDGSDLASSDRHLRIAAEADPAQPEVWIYLGQNAQREHHDEEAVRDLERAVKETGDDVARNGYQIRRAYFTLGRLLLASGKRDEGEVYLNRYRQTAAASSAAAAASIAAKQAASASTVDPTAAAAPSTDLSHLANDAAANRAGTEAAATAAPTATATPGPATAASPALRSAESQLRTLLGSGYNDLGTAEARQQQYAAALHDFQQAEQFGDSSPALLHNIAIAAYRVGDTAEVRRALTRYFAGTPAPDDTRARLMLAMADFDGGHFADAAHSFHAAGDAVLADPRTVYTYAYAAARSGDAQQATTLADRLRTAGLPPDRMALVCNVYFVAENYGGSESCYRQLAADSPTLPRAHYFTGESLIHLDRPAEAIPQFQQELALTPGEPNVESSLAFAMSQTGHKDEADALLQKTIAAHPEHAEAQYQLGKLLAEQGKTAEALPHLEASVRSDESKDYAHYQLALALRKAGRTADAEREFAAYREIKDKHRNDRAAPAGAQPAAQESGR